MDRRLLRQIEKVAARWRHRWLLLAWISTWFGLSIVALLMIGAHSFASWYVPHASLVIAGVGAVASLAVCWLASRSARDPRGMAQKIESRYPELNTSLLAAVDQRAQLPHGRFGFLQMSVIETALRHAYQHSWLRTISPWQLLSAHFANLGAFCVFIISLVVLAGLDRPRRPVEVSPEVASTIAFGGDFDVTVDPGDAEVERGTSLWVMARFQGPLPPEAVLVATHADGATEQFAMVQSLKDPVFGARMTEIGDDLEYRVEFADSQTELFQVTVFEYPRLERADAHLHFPNYTSLSDRVVEDVRTISAVEGTQLTLVCRFNKPVATAELVDGQGKRTAMVASPEQDGAHLYEAQFEIQKSLRLELRLLDHENRPNQQPPEFVIRAVQNKPPDLKLVQPSRDMQVSPLEEVQLQANVWDDFGIDRMGVSYTLSSNVEEVVLAQAVGGKQRTTAEYLLALEDLGAEPDQLVSYYFWAEDQGPDGTQRRVSSDMFFAEVRHFDEIYREGEAPPGGNAQQQGGMPGGNSGPAQQLAELQKQIMNGTWRVMRREIAGTPSEQFGPDVTLLLDSQTEAMEQAEAMNERIQESAALRHMLDVRRNMLDAVQHLSEAEVNSQVEALTPALASEQAAYQSLLRLRAREHRVVQGRRGGGGGGGGGNRSQQQLQQLQLRDNESRYETESQARSQQEQQDGETRQVLNRLRELARRQGDLNERLQELQSALQEAQNEAEEKEIRRQLQRLREEQERILRDVDELRDRMDEPANQERMADQQQQLEQTRENVRRASEALEEGRIGRAVSAGTRAEREMEELRDEFRRRSSGRFQEEMREMRREAQQLETDQQQIGQQLEEVNQRDQGSKSLRDADQRDELIDGLEDQRERLERLIREMREMIQESESSEPLLASDLYDTAREALHERLPESLDATARSIARGFVEDAQQQERRVRSGVEEFRQGIERAAEHVLGDETEALRRARQELRRLRRDLEQEVARETGEGPPPDRPGDDPDPNAAPGSSGRQQDSDRQQSSEQPPGASEPNDGQQQPAPSPNGGGEQGTQQPPSAASESAGEQRGARTPGQSPGENPQGGESQSGPRRLRPSGPRELRSLTGGRRGGGGGYDAGDEDPQDRRNAAPLTGDDFLDWTDRLRDVEEMVADPELSAEAARIRDRARSIRQDVRRHSQPPNWEGVKLTIVQPLAELQRRISEELLRRTSPDALVPIDRDPVPPKYSEQVRRYYEQLGNGQ